MSTGESTSPTSEPATSAEPDPSSEAPTTEDPSSQEPATEESTSSTPPDVNTQASGDLTATDVVTGLVTPWDVEPLSDGRMLVSSRDTGEILLVDADGGTTVVGVLGETAPSREGGLLGLALSADERTLFAYVTTSRDNRVVALPWNGSRLGQATVIVSGIPNEDTHNGGGLILGPDGFLYASTGDARAPSLSQDTGSLNGKILRFTVTGAPAPGNPFDSLVYSYGHRNVQGLAFDDEGRLWAAEYGSSEWDELNVIEAGFNYGWPDVEGFGGPADTAEPVLTWTTDEASPSGLAFWQGSLWMAALQGESLIEIPIDGAIPSQPISHFGDYGRLRAVTPDGDSLLVTTSNTDGRGDPAPGDDRVIRITF